MYGPERDSPCSGCRHLLDSIDGAARHLTQRAPFHVVPKSPIARLTALATGAALRAPRGAVDSARLARDPDLAQALQRSWRFRSALASPTPPADWQLWLDDAGEVERDLHGGTAGVADESFYAALRAFAERHGAPRGVRDAIAFEYGLATHDFAAASRAADALLKSATEGKSWISADELRDGAVVAKLRTGNPEGARAAFTTLARLGARAPSDMRAMLLNAYLIRAEREAAKPAPARAEEP